MEEKLMQCSSCGKLNDSEALFCTECGASTKGRPGAFGGKYRKVYFYILLLLPVIVLAVALGYYKFLLPAGVAAIINGEEITVPELDRVLRIQGNREPADGRIRYQALQALITERLVLQEARKAGMSVSGEEIASVVGDTRRTSGLDETSFRHQIESQYGSMENFEKMLAQGILANRFVSEKIIPPEADVRTARAALDRWLQNRLGNASVRITLAEQWSGAGCGCCGNRAEASRSAEATGGRGGMSPKDRPLPTIGAAAPPTESSDADKARDAGLRYWREKHGSEKVSAKVTNFGCHMQIDIIKDNKIIGSLRYQGGRISE